LYCIFYAYSVLPLADATAIAFSQPLIVVILASVFSQERASWIGWCSVGIGLIGVLLMAPPAGTGELLGYAMALTGSTFGAASMLVQRSLALKESALVIAFFTLSLSAVLTLPTLGFAWVWPNGWQLAGLVAMGIASGLCQLVITQAFYHASAALIAPVTYTKILWAVLIGFLWFGDTPSSQILIGAAIVLAAAALNLSAARVAVAAGPST
ncbi:MAG: DMT family transporter, partial [Pseudomonadota bacterium]